MAETRDSFPGLACWVDWCYGAASVLRFGKHTIPSSQGIQQGDPLGPLLFSTALQPALRKAAQCPVELCFSYLDDAVLAGEAHAVAAALRVFQAEAAAAGLVLEPSKYKLVISWFLLPRILPLWICQYSQPFFRSSKLLPLSFWARLWRILITATLSPSLNELARRQPA